MNKYQSPRLPSKWLKWICKTEFIEELLGDLEESFQSNCKMLGLRRARWIYRMEVLKLLRRSVIKKPKAISTVQVALLTNYFLISVRNLRRHSLFSFINIFSLSVAMSSGLLVIGMVYDLLKFDEFHVHKHEVYRVVSYPTYEGRSQDPEATSPFYLGQELQRDLPDIQVTNLGRRLAGLASINGKFIRTKGIYADQHFFDFLTFDLLQGDPQRVLSEPFSVVLSQSFATKVFREQDPVGNTLTLEGIGDFVITGIVKDPPRFSHLQFEIIASMSTTPLLVNKKVIHPDHDHWDQLDRYYNYIFIPQNLQKQAVLDWLDRKAPTFYKDPEHHSATFKLQSINAIVPGPDLSDSIGPKMIYLPIIILSVISIAILLSAIFNYTNLSMARSLRRTREIGIRKLNGARKLSVLTQFTVEAMVISLLSLGFGTFLFLVLRQYFIEILPRAEEMVELRLSPQLLGYFVIFALVSGLIAGLGPALFFSRLSSLNALKSGKPLKSLSRINFRKVLICAQFAFGMIFVMGVIITHKQYAYSLNVDMGFDRSNHLNVDIQGNDPDLIHTEFLKHPEVSSVSFSSFTLGLGRWNYLKLIDPRNMDTVWVHQFSTDHNYLNQMSIPILAGRGFELGENTPLESNILVNETFVKVFGYEDNSEVIGQKIDLAGHSVEVIGVVKDFIYGNLEETIKSLVIRNHDPYRVASVELATTDILSTYQNLEKTWKSIDPKNDFEAKFYDDQVEDYYVFLKDFMKMFGFVGFLAISISCLGLLGIAVYATETRMKEIGIRKTFGASERSLVLLLSGGFLKIVSWAILIGVPICYALFDQVILAQNVYRTRITFTEIGLSVLFLLILSLSTIFSQTWVAARRNPSTVLRDE